MREVGGELAEGSDLFRLHLHARDLAHAAEQNGDAALSHRGDGLEHVWELLFGDIEHPDFANGVAGAAVALHARVRKKAGELAGTSDEEGDGAAGGAAHVDLAKEHDVHAHGRRILKEEHGAGTDFAFYPVEREPKVLFIRDAFEGLDA